MQSPRAVVGGPTGDLERGNWKRRKQVALV